MSDDGMDIDDLCSFFKKSIIKDRTPEEEYDYLMLYSKKSYYYLINEVEPDIKFKNDIKELFNLYEIFFTRAYEDNLTEYKKNHLRIIHLLERYKKDPTVLLTHIIFSHIVNMINVEKYYEVIVEQVIFE